MLSIVEVTPYSPRQEQEICEWMSKMSMKAKGAKSAMLTKDTWVTSQKCSYVYLLIKGDSAVGYLILEEQEHLTKENNYQQFVIRDVFVAEDILERQELMSFLSRGARGWHLR